MPKAGGRSAVASRKEPESVADLVVPGEKEPGTDGSVLRVTPKSAGWDWVGFEVVRLDAGRTLERGTGSEEVCLVVHSGRCDVFTGQDEWRGIEERESPFDGLPYGVYLPPATGKVEGFRQDLLCGKMPQGIAA